MRSTLFALLTVAAIAFPLSLEGQTAFEFEIETGTMSNGCAPPSPCLCPVFLVGDIDGTFTLTPIPGSLGPIFEYSVDVAEWTVSTPPAPPLLTIFGSGTYMIDVSTGLHEMNLTLDVGGAIQDYTSGAFVAGGEDFPTSLSIYLYHSISGCEYNGLWIDTSSFTIPEPLFVRGDCNDDGSADISDAIAILGQLFIPGTPAETCPDACDVNDDGANDVGDAIYQLASLFVAGSPAPPAPYPNCDFETTGDALATCDYSNCP
ncbi:MAG: hypothetical protein AAF488_17025 [Planctomycetota bacterium]